MAVVLLFVQCTYHNKEDYFRDSPDLCNTANMSFSADIFPIFQNNCIMCHNNNSSPAGVNFSSYENVKPVAESGRLLGAIKHEDGFYPMPQSAPKLDDCTINKISAWIDQGLQNN